MEIDSNASSIWRSVLEYASRGWSLFPVTSYAKTPLTKHGCNDATRDRRTLNKWWTCWPEANIGLATGRISSLIALDFDCKNGKAGLATRNSLHQRFEINTLTAETPSGGIHEIFAYPGPVFRNSVERLPGLDIRTDHGYIVIAPSVVDGNRYRWTNVALPAELPAGLQALLREPIVERPVWHSRTWHSNRLQIVDRARRYVAAVPGAVEGEAGDVGTYKLACRLVRGFALTDDEALMLLWFWNLRCHPKWSESELLAKIASAHRNGKELIGARAGVCA